MIAIKYKLFTPREKQARPEGFEPPTFGFEGTLPVYVFVSPHDPVPPCK